MKAGWIGVFMLTCAGLIAAGAQYLPSPQQTDAKIEAKGLQNVFRITDKLLSGSSPEEDAGFQSLQKLGVKTIVSVDGAQPDLERAHKFGIRYVHIPIGYDGVPTAAALRMARAVRDLPGPVYIHCHHGQHRGPASAAAVHLLLDPTCTVEKVIGELKRAGTDPKYAGLYAAPAAIHKLGAIKLDSVPAEFPEAVKPAGLTELMVHVDEQWDKLKLIKAAGWKTPKSNPDLTPAHEALMLVESFREAARLPEMKAKPQEFRTWLSETEDASAKLESALASEGGMSQIDAVAAEQAFKAVGASCARCHAKYRDVR